MTTEIRFAELRDVDGRRIEGRLITYGAIAVLPWGQESIRAGAFGNVGAADIILNVQHDRGRPVARTGGGGLELLDGAAGLDVLASLPETAAGDEALRMVQAGLLRGLSVEFLPLKQRRENDVLILESGQLVGAGLVDKPAYADSTLREKPRRRLWL